MGSGVRAPRRTGVWLLKAVLPLFCFWLPPTSNVQKSTVQLGLGPFMENSELRNIVMLDFSGSWPYNVLKMGVVCAPVPISADWRCEHGYFKFCGENQGQ